jgi:hypothetical protein
MQRGMLAGFARIMTETPRSDGQTADLISNWFTDERGYLKAGLPLMHVIPDQWRGSAQPACFSDVVAMAFMMRDGEVPEYAFITASGVFRYAPWTRPSGGSNAGLEEIKYYLRDNTTTSVVPQGKQRYPTQTCVVGNRLFISYCDGGGLWVYDFYNHRMRPFGFLAQPSPPNAEGPAPTGASRTSVNAGGFSVRGRVGNVEGDWTGYDGTNVVAIGGIDSLRRRYGVVWEGPDGNYSETSDLGGQVSMRAQLADPDDGPERLRRRFRVKDLPPGPDHAVAAIVLATPNLDRLPSGDDGSLRFLTRLPSAIAPEHIDDKPDGELGAVWQDRTTPAAGVFFVTHAFGSTWLMRSQAHPSRVWWSEQTGLYGPVPESFMAAHWRDVFPNTGPITGFFQGRLSYDADNIMFILKEGACHYLSGGYPNWQAGTLHTRAGCAGWGLVQVAPDGSAVWYGNGTFWRFDPADSSVKDVGGPIRKRLRRVNRSAAQYGVSYRVVSRGEMMFWLPMDGSDEPNQGFVWDYLTVGWRVCDHFESVKCAVSIDTTDETFVFGKRKSPPSAENATVWVEGRYYPGQTQASLNNIYRSGWVSSEKGPDRNHPFYAGRLMFSGEEAANNNYSLAVYRNWNFDAKETEGQDILAVHPDSENISFYNAAIMGTAVYRAKRHYIHEMVIDSANSVAISIELSGSGPFTLFGADPFNTRTFDVFGTNPGGLG